mmetsp:Transcript_13608/g.54524  ORF Transcript_13608/g.54524 Transcript_13608/m.54524 type:complete len:122 (-) Transcript_13608:369-734(-)
MLHVRQEEMREHERCEEHSSDCKSRQALEEAVALRRAFWKKANSAVWSNPFDPATTVPSESVTGAAFLAKSGPPRSLILLSQCLFFSEEFVDPVVQFPDPPLAKAIWEELKSSDSETRNGR